MTHGGILKYPYTSLNMHIILLFYLFIALLVQLPTMGPTCIKSAAFTHQASHHKSVHNFLNNSQQLVKCQDYGISSPITIRFLKDLRLGI